MMSVYRGGADGSGELPGGCHRVFSFTSEPLFQVFGQGLSVSSAEFLRALCQKVILSQTVPDHGRVEDLCYQVRDTFRYSAFPHLPLEVEEHAPDMLPDGGHSSVGRHISKAFISFFRRRGFVHDCSVFRPQMCCLLGKQSSRCSHATLAVPYHHVKCIVYFQRLVFYHGSLLPWSMVLALVVLVWGLVTDWPGWVDSRSAVDSPLSGSMAILAPSRLLDGSPADVAVEDDAPPSKVVVEADTCWDIALGARLPVV